MSEGNWKEFRFENRIQKKVKILKQDDQTLKRFCGFTIKAVDGPSLLFSRTLFTIDEEYYLQK